MNRRSTVAWVLSCLSGATAGCTIDHQPQDETTTTGAALEGSGGEDGGAPPASHAARRKPAHLRVGGFLGGSFDFCLRRHDPANSAPYDIGPVLESRGAADGLVSPAVTTYFDLSPDQYDIRFVYPTATDCTQRIVGLSPSDITDAPLLEGGTFWTFVRAGFGNHGTAFGAFRDEHRGACGQVRMRYVSMEGFNRLTDFGFGTGALFSPFFSNVAPGHTGSAPGADALGYVSIDPTPAVYTAIRFSGNGSDISYNGVSLAAGEVVSFFGYGVGSVAVCHDLAPAQGAFSDCSGPPGMAIDGGTDAIVIGDPHASTSGSVVEFYLPHPGALPYDIVAAPDGALWFTESNLGKIGRITTDGALAEYSTRLPTDDATQNVNPRSLSVGPDGALWFGQIGRVGRMALDGTLSVFPLAQPTAIVQGATAGADGNMWVSEGSAIARLALDGTLTEFSLVTADDPYATASVIASGPDGNVWFAFSSTKGIGRITPDGQITRFPLPSDFLGPAALLSASDGNLWFTDELRATIGRITPAGEVTAFALPASDAGSTSVLGLAAHGNDLWFTEVNTARIGRMSTDGTFLGEYATPAQGFLAGVVFGPDGRVWYTSRSRNTIGRLVP